LQIIWQKRHHKTHIFPKFRKNPIYLFNLNKNKEK
jgi:hypothetical protein